MAPVVENAQQDPHCPWSFTGVTAPCVLQSTEAVFTGAAEVDGALLEVLDLVDDGALELVRDEVGALDVLGARVEPFERVADGVRSNWDD